APSPARPASAHSASAIKKEQPSCLVRPTRPPPQDLLPAIIMEAGVSLVSRKILFLPVCIALTIGLVMGAIGCHQNASSPPHSASQHKTITTRGNIVAPSGHHIPPN